MATDLFGRTTSYGLGTDGTFTYVWIDRDSRWPETSSNFHVDGSQVVIPAGGSDWDSYIITAPTPAKSGSVSFDTYFPNLSSNFDFWHAVMVHLAWTDEVFSGRYSEVVLGFEQDYNYDYTDPHILFGPYADGDFEYDTVTRQRVTASIAILPTNWYTFKCSYTIFADGHYIAGYKVWKRGDAEPSDFQIIVDSDADNSIFPNSWADGQDGKPWIDFYYSGTYQTYFDNLTFDSSDPGIYHREPSSAIIRGRQEVTSCEPFSFTTSYGLGMEYPFIPGSTDTIGSSVLQSTTDDPTAAFVSVDGSKTTMAAVGSQQINAYQMLGRRAPAGWLQFDFLAPSPNGGTNFNGTSVWVVLDGADRAYSVGLAVTITGLSGPSDLLFTIASSGAHGLSLAFISDWASTHGNWYTAKVFYDDAGQTEVLIKAQGADDSAALARSTLTGYSSFGSTATGGTGDRIVFRRPATNGHNLAIDNLCWQALSLTADAVIFVSPSLTADAVIFRTQTGSFTANANFLQAFNAITGNAVIKAAQTGSALADAVLVPMHFYGDAYITDLGLLRHDWYWDHDGTMPDTGVTLDSVIAGYPVGTTLRTVMEYLWMLAAEKT